MDKNLFVIAGCNGAGKTTASFTILPEILNCKEFVNADEIAKGISPFQPESVSFEAGRIMLGRIDDLLRENKSFAFETTLSTKSYKGKIIEAKQKGYKITLLFFWLKTIELAIESNHQARRTRAPSDRIQASAGLAARRGETRRCNSALQGPG